MTALFVAEEVVDPFLFHQAADEIEAGFAILHAVFPLAIGAAEGVFEVGEPQVAKHLFDDLRDGQVLKNTAIGGAGQQPQPGPKGRMVTGDLARVTVSVATRNDAGTMPS